MPFWNRDEELISFLEEYLKINDLIYEQDLIRKELEDFDKKSDEKLFRHMMKDVGYEDYTELTAAIEKSKLIEELFKEYPGMIEWAKELKFFLLRNKKMVESSAMTLGLKSDTLSPMEIMLNESKARKTLQSLKIKQSINKKN
ncbi:MAG: hypothetical protein K5666_03835 [Bacilli bacterium]|nr:hypothetical protein [Bacilli bacterium]